MTWRCSAASAFQAGLLAVSPAGCEQPVPHRSPPALADELLALADAAIAEFDLGADEVPDLLAISIGTTDYVGHAFGGDSWEYLDTLVRLDRAVGAWLARIEKRGPIAVLATSDHGAAPLAERSAAAGEHGGRIDPVVLESELEVALRADLGRENRASQRSADTSPTRIA